MRRTKPHGIPRRLTALVLCLCMIVSMVNGFGATTADAADAKGYTEHIVADSRVADPDTMDDYLNRLLTETSGSRYAGRVWTDKTVFAYGYNNGDDKDHFDGTNKISLDMLTDGYKGDVLFNADFAHVFSALASSQVVNEYPPSPVDLVIVFDMSGSMGQDTRYSIDPGYNTYQEHVSTGDSPETPWPAQGVLMSDRIEHSRVQATLCAINETIDALMAQNPQNRVAVCGYGANAVVLLPLGHYKRAVVDGVEQDYLSVGGMETLYHPSDLVYRTPGDGLGSSGLASVSESGWYWMNNRDTCYTVVVNAQTNNYTGILNDNGDGKNQPGATADDEWHKIHKIVSNNALDSDGNPVKAFPGAWDDDGNPKSTYGDASQEVYKGSRGNTSGYIHGTDGAQLIQKISETKALKADDYVGYFTNTQGGIYLAYKQLADSAATTYTEPLTNGVISTVARIPAAIVMSDGGSNFSFNEMGNGTDPPTVNFWNARYGQKVNDKTQTYISDDSSLGLGGEIWENRTVDVKHRLGVTDGQPQLGDEWYNVYLPGNDTLKHDDRPDDKINGYWDGLHGIFNVGADYHKDGTLSSQPYWNYAGVLYSSDRDLAATGGVIIEVLLTASYMSTVVKKHYSNGWTINNATLDSQIPLSTYTMNVDTEHVPQWGRWRLFPTLNPKDYAIDSIGSDWGISPESTTKDTKLAETYDGETWGTEGATYVGYGAFSKLKESWDSWKRGDTTDFAADAGNRIRLERLEAEGHTYQAGGSVPDIVTVTNEDVIENIAYNNEFYDITSGGLGDTFETILGLILGKVFVPISGDNDAGVGDSVTYQDPIGEYMEIKNGSINATPHHIEGSPVEETEQTYDMALLLFGEMHGLVRTGVYDYQWNDAWIVKNEGKDAQGTAAMRMGWYKGEATSATYGGAGEVPKADDGKGEALYTDPVDAWKDGWVYRVDYKTLTQYVPLVETPETPGELSDQAKNTVYTLYRFAGTAENRNALRRNPIYGEGVPQKFTDAWDGYYASHEKYPEKIEDVTEIDTEDYPGIYRLSDIRVWVEDTGDFVDTDGAITPNTGYDRSLYVNIPAAAIPTELATITMGRDGVLSYETNLGKDHPEGSDITVEKDGKGVKEQVTQEMYENFCAQSTPFRLFYAVGLEEDLILRDESGNQTGVDFNAISPEYISSHTVEEQDYVWFISNFYSGTRYGEYATDENTHTRGDPTVSFSPGVDNRYYVFQKPLPLYAHAYRAKGGSLTPVDNENGGVWTDANNRSGNGGTTWEKVKDAEGNEVQQQASSWVGGQYMGAYENVEAFNSAKERMEDGLITDSSGIKYEYVDDGIVFLQEDLLEHVTSNKDGGYTNESVSFSSDDYFFLLVEFYVPYKDTVGKDNNGQTVAGTQAGHMVQYALARKGSEFGSGFASSEIDNGDMLCWTDAQNNLNLEFAYLSKTDTGDLTRGEPTFEKLTYKKDSGSENDLEKYLSDTCGISGDVLNDQVEYWTQKQKDPMVMAALNAADKDGLGLTEAEFKDYFKFAVAARPGGIRSGDMSNNLQYKGTVYDGPTQLYNNNVTKTSNTYYLPTISDNSGTDNNVIINNYLGNNGRLEIANQRLHVTKMMSAPEGYTLTDAQKNETFNYQIFVQGVTGKRTAIQTQYNEYSGTWERRLAYIDVLTDNSDLVLTSGSTRAVFVQNEDGTASQVVQGDNGNWYYANEDGTLSATEVDGSSSRYYLYLPANGTGSDTQHVRRLYQSDKYDGADATEYKGSLGKNSMTTCTETEGDRPAGTQTYGATDAVLIPVNEVDDAEASTGVSGSGWRYEDLSSVADHKKLTSHTFVIRKPSGETSAEDFTSPYATRSQYLTVELNFGYNANANDGSNSTDGVMTTANLYDSVIPTGDRPDLFTGDTADADYIAQHTAEFTLKHGEGLLLTGLQNRVAYRFTEKLTEEQMNKGYTLKKVSHIQQRGSESIYQPGVQQVPVYTAPGATYGSHYPEPGAQIENGLTWPTNPSATVSYEPFAHTNAIMWEYYATMGDGDTGNHHQPSGSKVEEAPFQKWTGEPNKYVTVEGETDRVEDNPSCKTMDLSAPEKGGCDVVQRDGTTRHYMYYEGKLVDPHYEGEASAYLRNMARYLVSPTVHFAVKNEPDKAIVPSTPNEDYTGVYSVFGNTGWFEEQAHFENTFKTGSISITKKLEAEEGTTITDTDEQTKFSFTLQIDSTDAVGELSGKYTYTITGSTTGTEVSGELGNNTRPDDNGVYKIDNDTWAFKLSKGQTMTIDGLSLGTDYLYKVTEINPGKGYDVKDSDDTPEDDDERSVSGTVKAGDSEPAKVEFTNTKKKPEPVPAAMPVQKNLVVQDEAYSFDPDATAFTFDVVADPKNPDGGPDIKSTEVKLKKSLDGTYQFSKDVNIFEDAEFKQPGKYVYTVTEKHTSATGITYDASTYVVTINVEEKYVDGMYTGELESKLSFVTNSPSISGKDVIFGNQFNPKEVGVSLNVKKTLQDKTGKVVDYTGDMEFEFELSPIGNAPMPELSSTSVSKFVSGKGYAFFDTIKYTEPGTYYYRITETATGVEHVTYDPTTWTAKVIVREEDEALKTYVAYEHNVPSVDTSSDYASFVNWVDCGSLTVSKTVTGEGGDKTKDWTFTVTLSNTSISGTYGGMTFTDGIATFTLKDGESLTAAGLPAGVTYTVEESEANEDGYTTNATDATGTIPENGTAEAKFVNDKPRPDPETGSLAVRKTVTGTAGDTSKEWHFTVTLSDRTITGTYGGMTFTNGVATFTLKHGESKTATGLPAGITYTVTETDANTDGYTTTWTGETSGTIKAGSTAEVECTNDLPEPKTGCLTVTKTVTGEGGDKTKDWTFTVTLSDTSISGTYGGMTFTDGIATFTLKDGESLTAAGLPADITYTVTEAEADTDGYTTSSTDATGTIPDSDTAKAEFVNDKPTTPPPPGGNFGNLTVTKTVTGTAGDTSKVWNFTVTLSDETITGPYGDMTFTNGVATFTLKHGESKTANNLPAGITYTVTEAEANADGYTTNATDATGTIPENDTARAAFVNDKTPPPPEDHLGNLTVTKTVTGEGDRNKEWHFTVTLSDTSVNGTYGGMTFTNGIAEFTLKHGDSKTAEGLPVGVSYTVTETEANADDYATTADGATGTIPNGGTARAEFVNDKTPPPPPPSEPFGNLTVSKNVTGEGDTSKQWYFRVELSEPLTGQYGDMHFVDGVASFTLRHGESITASGLPVGITYTVTEEEANQGGYRTEEHLTEGTITAGTIEAWFINDLPDTDTGNLTVTKTVTGEAGDTSKEWHFTVTLDDDTVNGWYGDMYFRNGVATFTLKHGGSLTATDLPAGIGYTVTEDEAGEDGYTTSGSGITGAIPGGSTATAHYENRKDEPDTGNLTVTKVVTGAGDPEKLWHITVTLDDPTVDGIYGGMTFHNGVASFTLRHGETVTATGLPANAWYTVSEAEANTDGYETTEYGTVGTIPESGTADAVFENDLPEPGGLTVTKTVEGEGADTTKEWHFTVTLSDSTINGTYGGMTFTNGVASFTLKHGESLTATGLPADITYSVSEAEANTDGYTTTATGETGTITADAEARAEFVNSKEAGALTVSKILEGESADPNKDWTFTVTLSDPTINGTYGGMTFTNGVATFTLKGGQTLTATGLPAGITYTVTEAEANTDGYKTTSTGASGEITEGGNAQAVFTNSIDTGALTVSKILEGENADPNKDWTFTVTLSDTSINGTYGGMTFTNGVATFTLKGGQTITATGLPAGITYTVTEAEANTDGYKTTSIGETGEIPLEGSADAVFTNTIGVGDLIVSKILEGESADPNKDWTFTVTLSDPTINGTYGGMTFVNGVATFTLKGGESLTATGLPAGITYTVTEAEANTDGYTTTSTGETGEIPAEGSAEAVFTNSIEEGALTVVKNIEGKEADPNKDWTFTVTLSDTTINGTYGGMTIVNGVATFTLKGGQSLTATGLPAGITYTVTEAEANTDGYTTRTAGTTGTIPADGEAVATFVNSKGEVEKGNFAVRKRVRGEDADPNQVFHFIITLSDPTISGTFGDVTFENGIGQVALKEGEHAWILGLPVGTTYTVTEVEANQDGYQTHGEAETGAVPATGHNEARFTNFRGPGEPNWDEPWEELPDPEVPLAPPEDNPSDNPPQTNDQFNRELWMLMMAAAFLGMTAQFLPGKRKEEA